MNNPNMVNMAAMGGPVGAPMNMMNNGAMPPQGGPPRGAMPPGDRTLLNTYIYEYFIRYQMFECARSLLNTDHNLKVHHKDGHRDENGGLLGNSLGDDAMDTDSKGDIESKRPDDLPAPNVPMPLPDSCFLFEWFSLFWDMFNAQKTKVGHNSVNQYVAHTQNQSRMRQNHQQDMLRNMRPDIVSAQQQQFMMRNMPNGQMINMKGQNPLPRAAMANSQNNPQAMQMLQQKQGQMSRDPSDMDGSRPRPSSPNSTDNAPSPSKRPRLDGGPFNPNQPQMVPNGQQLRQGIPGGQQLPNKPMPNVSGPPAQGSPMVQQGPDGANLTAYYNTEMAGAGGMRPAPGGAQAGGGSNHALQDYQMQLMLLEQQNKKRLMMARQEQDGMTGMRPDGGPAGPGGPPGPNAQAFQGTSPPGGRTGASPNPGDMKRNQQMGNAGMGSPVPDHPQSRNSPNPVSFMGNIDPSMAPNFFNGMKNVDGNMAAAQMNGMRPPHPGQPFNGQMNQQQMLALQRQQAQQAGQGGPGMQWQQGGPNGNPMGPQGPQGPAQQVQGTPQQRAMPPPSAPAAAAANANQRNQTASPQVSNAAPPTPQQSTKGNPKKKETKSAKSKAATQKKSNPNLNNAGATPAAEAPAEAEPPTPATPITPVNPQSFNKAGQNAAGAPVVPNGQPAAPPAPASAPVAAPHTDPNQNANFLGDGLDFGSMDFANPLTSDNVLQDFDFDSFLHNDSEDPGAFDFNASGFGMEGGEIGAD